MDITQVNNAADQIALERQQNGRTPQTAARAESADAGRAAALDEGKRLGSELARALTEEMAGEPVLAPRELRLRVEQDIDTVVAKIVDSQTEEVVREIPPEELVDAAKKLNAILGQLLDREV